MIEEYLNAFRKLGPTALAGLSADEQTAVANWAREIVDQYGSILNELTMKIKDVEVLPRPKETIKIAIKTLMQAYVLTESEDMLSLLKNRYVRLSDFQEISPEDKSTVYTEVVDGNRVSTLSDSSLDSTHQKYLQLVLSEEKILHEDIEAYHNSL